jgi:hypothetical protein
MALSMEVLGERLNAGRPSRRIDEPEAAKIAFNCARWALGA